MKLKTNGQTVELLAFSPGGQTVRLVPAEAVELGETLEVWTTIMAPAPTDEEPEREEEWPYLLASYTVADWLRVVRGEDGSITLTQLPESAPAPEPESPGPSLEDDMMTMIVDHEARLTAVEEGVTL